MKLLSVISAVAFFSTTACQAQIKNAKTETVKVYGNCGMCETTIEKAANKSKTSKADWNEETKMATITYDSKKTNADAVLKNIAIAGYDNQSFLAPDAVYNKLPGCCKYDREKKTLVTVKDNAMAMNNHTGHDQANTVAIQQVSQLQIIFDNYFLVKDALIKTDATTAQAKVITLLTALNAVKMETLKVNEHTAWMKVEKDLKMNAQHISESKEIDRQREHFISLSKNMITLIKSTKPNTIVYLQHCPMANDGKGADWLSKENAVKNPYYGSVMMTCGKTVETLQ